MDMKILKSFSDFKLNESVSGSVRVRFAPSPTGSGLHAGGVRTALYNYLFAKNLGGKLILRIEDTDRSRFVPGAEQHFQDVFEWLGIEFDESPSKGGNYGPYRQSERTDIYEKYYKELISNGYAYYAFDSTDSLNTARENDMNFSYNFQTRNDMINSLTLSKEETDVLLKENNDWVVRIKYPDTPTIITVNDIIRGKVTVNTSTLDDKVIWKKKDGLPTYHLANIVDDHLMKITHVIRGEEWLPSAPLHVFLYQSFGWTSPQFAHLPLILGPNGGKLSKRDGDKYGFSVYPISWYNSVTKSKVLGYKDLGFLPSAVLNLLAFIGWNPGTEKEVYTLDELIKDFDLKRVNKAGGKFNPVKAAWFNGQHLKNTPTIELVDSFKDILIEKGIERDSEFIFNIVDENKGKVNFIKEMYDIVNYLFETPTEYDKKLLRKWDDKSFGMLMGFKGELINLDTWKSSKIQSLFEKYNSDNDIKFGLFLPILKVVLTGHGKVSSIFNAMEMIGKDETLKRLSDSSKFDKNINNDVDNTLDDVESLDQNTIQLNKELELITKSITSIEKNLSNQNFISRAPAVVVEGERKKLDEFKNRLIEIEKELGL